MFQATHIRDRRLHNEHVSVNVQFKNVHGKLKKIKVNKNVNWTLVIRSNLKCSNQPNSQDIIGVDN